MASRMAGRKAGPPLHSWFSVCMRRRGARSMFIELLFRTGRDNYEKLGLWVLHKCCFMTLKGRRSALKAAGEFLIYFRGFPGFQQTGDYDSRRLFPLRSLSPLPIASLVGVGTFLFPVCVRGFVDVHAATRDTTLCSFSCPLRKESDDVAPCADVSR